MNVMKSSTDTPLVLVGPVLRQLTSKAVTFWLATSRPVSLSLRLFPEGEAPVNHSEALTSHKVFKAGELLYFHCVVFSQAKLLPHDVWIGYDLALKTTSDSTPISVVEWASDICYGGQSLPGFMIKSHLSTLLHGSCRKPHLLPAESEDKKDSGDGLVRADKYLATIMGQKGSMNEHEFIDRWPALLMMSGDQVYADDVAGPMLVAIHQLIDRLKLPDETLEGTDLSDSKALWHDQPHYYKRDSLLPKTEQGGELRKQFFGGARKPVFTSSNANNHLMSLSEMLAMYLLVWSPECWAGITLERPSSINEQLDVERYAREQKAINSFKADLIHVRRVMAHVPSAMIFDDHDVTDDWNLTAGWEKSAYEHPLSRRVIGNALIAYLLCQGWGNAPDQFDEGLLAHLSTTLAAPGTKLHDAFITQLLAFDHWHFHWDTDPVLLVLDTRTHRWRSEKNIDRPSGLMDWESITDLQYSLLDKKAVVMVSPAPVFGVKLIESIQRVFTWAGYPLMVDAENWMAHNGAAHGLMNLFRHPRTPQHFVILSGDVHYSFVYDIELRGRKNSPSIWQITSSGLRNEFPPKLLDVFDRLNRWLYAPWSPLNWFTKRRGMRVSPRKPDNAKLGERLLNAAGIGLVTLDKEGVPTRIAQLCADGREIDFEIDDKHAQWE